MHEHMHVHVSVCGKCVHVGLSCVPCVVYVWVMCAYKCIRVVFTHVVCLCISMHHYTHINIYVHPSTPYMHGFLGVPLIMHIYIHA